MLEAKDLTMLYGAFKALNKVSFKLEKGEVVGFLGRNGAGKTTCMRIITSFMQPASGTVIVDGDDVTKDPIKVRKKIGYLPEAAPLYVDMEVVDYLRFVGKARGLGSTYLRERVDWAVQVTHLQTVFRKPIGQLSKGFRQRVGLAPLGSMVSSILIWFTVKPRSGW